MTASNENLTYREMLASGRFFYGAEVVTTRGLEPVDSQGNLASFARDLLADPRIGWISITDNPGGGPMLPPDWLAGLVAQHRARVVLHLTCKDMNRSGLEAAAWRYASEGFNNILAITGDYPTGGYGGRAEPVFDFDSVNLIDLLRSMNEGLTVSGRGGKPETLPKTDFFIGCVVSPFKRHERELVPQYFKLARKIGVGAQWVIPQLGYDMRKFHEVKLFLEARGIKVPIIGNVYLLNKGVAKLFNSGKLAGCVVSNELLRKIETYAAGPDKGKQFCQELAAKQLAVFKGLGFAAGYLGGIHKADGFGPIIELAESYGPDDWKDFLKEIQFSQPDEFFLFEHERFTGMSDAGRISREYLTSLKNPPKSKQVNLNYRLSRWAHKVGVHARQIAVSDAQVDLRPLGQEARLLEPHGVSDRENVEAGDVRLQGLRRLQSARFRVSLPEAFSLKVRPQWPLRRLGKRSLRAGRQGMFLGADLRAAEDLRRVGNHARTPRDDLQRHAQGDIVLGQHVPRPRPQRPQKTETKP